MPELVFRLALGRKFLSDPAWRRKSEKVSCKEELRLLLLQFCSENGEMVKVSEKRIPWEGVNPFQYGHLLLVSGKIAG